jgi:DNA-binding HxlR family transcriptional regulator
VSDKSFHSLVQRTKNDEIPYFVEYGQTDEAKKDEAGLEHLALKAKDKHEPTSKNSKSKKTVKGAKTDPQKTKKYVF